MGHPHNGAITFKWSWETDFNIGFGVIFLFFNFFF
jgi:hypothetical protein